MHLVLGLNSSPAVQGMIGAFNPMSAAVLYGMGVRNLGVISTNHPLIRECLHTTHVRLITP